MVPSPTSMGRRKTSPAQRRKSSRGRGFSHGGENRNQLSGEEEDGDEDEEDDDAESEGDGHYAHEQLNLFDSRVADKLYHDMQEAGVYEDGNERFTGVINRRGITPFVTFTTTETPPSQSTNRVLLDAKHKPTCGFCSSTNLLWVLKCSFCGCARMGDAPRLKYLLDMVLSVNPTITAVEVTKAVQLIPCLNADISHGRSYHLFPFGSSPSAC
jgi:hypothetical protein